MSKGNLVSGPIPADKYKNALKNIKDLLSVLKPFEVNLTEEEKKRIPKSGERIAAFIEKSIMYMNSNPEYMNGVMNAKEAENDRVTQKQAIELTEKLNIVLQILNDLYIAAGSDAYVASLDYYHSVKRSVERGDASAKQISEDLSKAFRRVSHKVQEDAEEDNTPAPSRNAPENDSE